MAWSLIAHIEAGSSDGNGFTTGAIDTSGASILVVSVNDYDLGHATLSDSKSNTWTPLTSYISAAFNVRTTLYYAKNPTVGAGHTFTTTGATSFNTMCVGAWSNADTTGPFDAENGAISSGTTSLATGTVTPAGAAELFVSGIGVNALETLAIDSSFSITGSVGFSGGLHFGAGLAWKESSSAENPTWSFGVSTATAVNLAAFKPAAGGPTGGGPLISGGQLTHGSLIRGGRIAA